jgi:4-hydroxy-tetrahydrodipicolinate synthase
MVTSFRDDGSLDIDAMRRAARYQIDSGASGVCVLGSTGEPLAMTVDEHKRAIDAVVTEVAGRITVTAGTLLGRQEDIVECGRHARACGADAIMVIPPYFVLAKPAQIRAHFEAIAEKVDMPMVLFHGPSRSGVRLDAEAMLGLIEAVPHFVAIKETSGDVTIAAELLRSAPPGVRVLQGFDELVLPTLALGAHGAMLSLGCLIPKLLQRLARSVVHGDMATARRLQLGILPLCRAIYSEPNPGPLKLALALAGRPAGPTRPPLDTPAAEVRALLEPLVAQVLEIEEESARADAGARDASTV